MRVGKRDEDQCAKLLLPFEGPYIINMENGINSYELIYPETRVRGIFNTNDVYIVKIV